jgi:glutamate dehydrogenase
MATSTMNAVCSQLLSQDDLEVSDKLFEEVQKESILTRIIKDNSHTAIKVFSRDRIYLSTITPILHDFGFDIIDEVTYNINKNKEDIYISKFNLDLSDSGHICMAKDNIEHVISDTLKSDSLDRCKLFALVYSENISIRNILLLRSFIEYIDQAEISLSSESILTTLTYYSHIAKLFVDYFNTKFDPELNKKEKAIKSLELQIDESIKLVPSIMDDRILKLTYSFIQSIIRTNFFFDKEAIALKIDTKTFSKDLKGLQPNIESFIFHPEFFGIHLRMSNISRGGLRWSDRHEDYRQEVKSLMITQEGKNSIIIPDGAKGGFIIHKDKKDITKEYFENIYSQFIDNMLDLVDNIKNSEVIRDERIVAYDGDDSYFVIAADKGTASMSDIANNIAIKRNYWLGDAFASGGSNGYGHKKLGITARGAIMCTKRFFIEEGIDIDKESVSVVGIGSMNGDVFGNGMLESKEFKLLAAIGHKEIFIDPNPIPIVSFEERQRLFLSKNAGWMQYHKSLISKGGGVFLRSDKDIELSAEMKKMLNTTKKTISGEELCRKILTMKVDLLFNGGVGTYVKSSEESNLYLGDKQNEAVRIDASDLNARIVSEGGNLGFTQKARIEYSLKGGKINLDGIDNAAGVDTSDHEVNLKILLNIIKNKGILNEEDANVTLHGLTEQVVNLVLWSNYQQSLAISKDEMLSKKYLDDFILSIETLESNISTFNRKDFFIPKNESISEIISINNTLVRPIIGSLISYSKIFIKKVILNSTMTDEPFSLPYLKKYFPKSFWSAFEHEIVDHPLKREIIATKIADTIINSQGITFISNYNKIGAEKFLLKIKSYIILTQLFGANDIKYEIYRNDYTMPVEEQYRLFDNLEHTLNFTTRWIVKYLKNNQLDAVHILDHKEELFDILGTLPTVTIEEIIPSNNEFNRFFGVIEYLRFSIAVIMITEKTHHSFKDVMTLFYLILKEFKILELIKALNDTAIVTKGDYKLKVQAMQFIEFIIMHYTERLLEFQRINESSEVAFENYKKNEYETFNNISEQIESFMNKEIKDLQSISITINQLVVSII